MSPRLGRQDGSALVEGMAAMLVVFVLLVLIVQVAFVVVAHDVAATAVAAAARRAARAGADPAAAEDRLAAEIASALPGAEDVTASVTVDTTSAEAVAWFSWRGPGPDVVPVRIVVRSRVRVAPFP